MKLYLKVMDVHVILAFLKVLLLLLKGLRRKWLLVLLRWFKVYSRSQRQNMVHTCTYIQAMAKDKKQYNNTVK
jgi:hypothetical protein